MERRPTDGPLPVEMVCAAALSQRLHPEDGRLLEQIVTWRRTPDFPQIGRSAWLRLAHPFEAPCGRSTQVIRSLKVKGVGLRDHRGGVHRASNVAYRRPDAHLGIDEHGGFRELWSDPAPMGGLALHRAVVEYTTAQELSGAGPISEVPLFVYRYTGLAGFRDDAGSRSDLAVLVAGLPAGTPARADNLVHYARQTPAVQADLRAWAREQTGAAEFDWARAQQALWREYGKRLNDFHRGGFYRHNAHPCNLGLGPHGVFLVDLDSTRPMLECPPRVRTLQALRDAAGAVFHIVADTIRSAELPSPETAWATHSTLIDAFLGAYFPESPVRAFEEVKTAAYAITTDLWTRWAGGIGYLTDGESVADRESVADGEYQAFMTERHSQRSRGVDGPVLFCKLMPGLATAYAQARPAGNAAPIDPAQVRDAAETFLRQRLAYPVPG